MNQGYAEYEYPSNSSQSRPYQQQQQQPPMQAGTRIIPIQMESTQSPNNNNTIVIQG